MVIYIPLIREWAHARNLIKGSTPEKQFVKLVEEIGELAAALARGNKENMVDGIGDAVVVLTILASQIGVDIEDCIASAYFEIKDRKGRMQDGVFIKDGD